MKSDYKYLQAKQHIEVSDLALASTIQYLGFPITAINKDPKEHPKVSFVFEKSEGLDSVVQHYWEGLLVVEPKLFWNIARELKSRTRTN